MDTFFEILMVVAYGVLLMVVIGIIASIEAGEWEDDCKTLKMHREGNRVYQCTLDARQPAN